jgi:hypothetical protein
MEAINELIKRYGLEEDPEHVIIPVRGENGHARRYFLLKRRFMRIVYPEGYHVDYPLTEVIEATLRYPDLLLSEALYLMHKESGAQKQEITVEEKKYAD